MKQLCLSVNEKNNFQIIGEAIQSSIIVAQEIKEKEEKIIIHQNQTQINF